MELRLFRVTCNNEECGYSFDSTSTERISCPSCGEENIKYSDDYDVFESDIKELVDDKGTALTAILIASSYISNDVTIARFDDNTGLRINLKSSEFTDKFIKILNLNSKSDLVEMIYDELEDAHENLIYDPIFDCIERDSYYDEDSNLYESGHVRLSVSKKFYHWIENNKEYVLELLGISSEVFLVKELHVSSGEFKKINLRAILGEDLALEYIDEEIESYNKDLETYSNMNMFEDGFETGIYNVYGNKDENILFGLDVSKIDITNGVPDEVYVYTEINTYDSGEIEPHALAFLTKKEAKKEMVSEINNRADKDSENYYWISSGDIEDDYVKLEDEHGNISYLECSCIKLNSK